MLGINKLFAVPTDPTGRNPAPPNSLKIDADPVNMLLIAKGSRPDVEAVRAGTARASRVAGRPPAEHVDAGVLRLVHPTGPARHRTTSLF